MKTRIFSLLSLVSLAGLPLTGAAAQDIDQAIIAYNEDKYVDAAVLFYDVMVNSDDPDSRVKAEYYTGHSLFKAGYPLAAMRFYGEVFNAGKAHPFFLKATEGLLKVAESVGDDTLIPELIYKGYTAELSKLNSKLNEINYLIGMIWQRRGSQEEAQAFLEAVNKKSPLYPKARYLLAILALKTAVEEQAGTFDKALGYFNEVEKQLEAATSEDEKKLYRLALLGKARAYYSQGDLIKSIEFYEAVPRFSDDWYEAMFESGWAYFQNAEFGKALGMVHAIQSPYFDGRYRAESWVLKATTYFQLCHFDRGRKALDQFFLVYEPMLNQLKPLVEGDKGDTEFVELITNGAEGLPEEIRGQIVNNRRFAKFKTAVEEAERELAEAEREIPEGNFKAQLVDVLENERDQRATLTGKLVREQLRREVAFLEGFLTQARTIKFETADLERKYLEAGKDITKGPRARGPRPHVPSAQYQYWAFSGEYWIDELGYYEHSIKDECLAELQ